MTDLSQAADVVKRLQALVIMDEVGSDNPLGRDAAALIEALLAERADRNAIIEECAKVADDTGRRWALGSQNLAKDPKMIGSEMLLAGASIGARDLAKFIRALKSRKAARA